MATLCWPRTDNIQLSILSNPSSACDLMGFAASCTKLEVMDHGQLGEVIIDARLTTLTHSCGIDSNVIWKGFGNTLFWPKTDDFTLHPTPSVLVTWWISQHAPVLRVLSINNMGGLRQKQGQPSAISHPSNHSCGRL